MMTERELKMRMHAERAPLPEGFQTRHDRLLRDLTAKQRAPRMRMKGAVIFALALIMLAACGAAVAARYYGMTAFWYDPQPGAQELIESGISQKGGVMESATFTVREAVFDGSTLQVVMEIRVKEGYVPVDEFSDKVYELYLEDDPQRRPMDVSIDLMDINGGISLSGGMSEPQYEDDGTMILYQYMVMEEPVDADVAHVKLGCRAWPDGDYTQMESASLTFDIPRVESETIRSDAVLDMQQFTITALEAVYTPLRLDVTLRYIPGERLKHADLLLFVLDGEREEFSDLTREPDGDGYVVHLRTERCPDTLPDSLVIGVRGLDCRAVYNFADGTAQVMNGEAEQ